MPQNSREEKKAQASGLCARLRAKFRRHRPKAPTTAPALPTPETTNGINDVDREGAPMAFTHMEGRPDCQAQLAEKGTGVPEEPPNIPPPAVIDDDCNDDTRKIPSNLWDEAFRSLKSDERAQLTTLLGSDGGQDSPMFTKPDFASLKAEVQQKQDQCDEKSWRVSVGVHVLIVRDFAAQSATWLQTIGDIVIPFAPTAASAPWGLIKGALQIAVSFDQQMLVLLATLDEVLKVVHHGQIYESLYTAETTRDDVLQALHIELLRIYNSALQLLAFTKHQLSHGTLKNIVEAIVNPTGAEGVFSDLKARHVDLSHAAQLCETWRCAEADSRLLEAMRAINAPITRLEEKIDTHFRDLESAKMIEILDAISSIPHTRHHEEYQENRTPNTCNWLLDDNDFRAWERSSSSGVFWLWGTAGVGKSFLTSRVIDHLQDKIERKPNRERLAFFYCRRTRGEEERSKPLSVLQSFLRQLARHLEKPDMMQSGLIETYDKIKKDNGSFNRSICEPLLLHSFDLYPRTALVIDALDECDSASRDELIEFLSSALTGPSSSVKIFISCRPDDDKRKFDLGQNVGIHADRSRSDMRLFIDQRLESMMKNNHAIAELSKRISDRLFAKCDGMFQWTHLQLEQLRTCRTQESIDTRLNTLPSGLKNAYDEIYERIKQQDDLAQDLVDRAVMWVKCAAKPLTSDEILSAIRIDGQEEGYKVAGEINEEDLLFFCQHLLVIDHGGMWRLFHLLVMEYFEQNYWTLPEAHLYVGNACLQVLLERFGSNAGLDGFDDETRSSGGTICETPPRALGLNAELHNYVLWHWPIHARAQNNRQLSQVSSMTVLLVKFLGIPASSSFMYRSWVRHLCRVDIRDRTPATTPLDHPGAMEPLLPSDWPMLLVCHVGIDTALGERWWDNLEGCLEQVNSMGSGLIQIATESNCFEVCDRLLDAGAPVDAGGRAKGDSLSMAIYNRNLELVQLLLQKNRLTWDSLIQHDTFKGVLYHAFRGGIFQICHVLGSDDRLDVNMYVRHHGSLLQASIKSDDPAIVELLINRGANVNLAYDYGIYGSALAAAAAGGNLGMYLIDCGADVNVALQCGDYGNALAIAAHEKENLDTVKCLVASGADINLPLSYGKFGSALAAATNTEDNLDTIRYLVGCGAHLNVALHCGDYGSALAAAAESSSSTVKYLVDCGADINLLLECGIYGSALTAAVTADSWFNNRDTVEYLVENGADVNLQLKCGTYGSALAAAALCNNLDIIKYLVNLGSQTNVLQDCGYYGSVLDAAISSSQADLETVKYLVDHGADVNLPLRHGKHGSALAATAASGSAGIAIARYLVDCGAVINLPLQYGEFGSALAAAAYFGRKELVEFLISKGAMVNLKVKRDRFSNAAEAAEVKLSEEEVKYWNSFNVSSSRVADRVGV